MTFAEEARAFSEKLAEEERTESYESFIFRLDRLLIGQSTPGPEGPPFDSWTRVPGGFLVRWGARGGCFVPEPAPPAGSDKADAEDRTGGLK